MMSNCTNLQQDLRRRRRHLLASQPDCTCTSASCRETNKLQVPESSVVEEHEEQDINGELE